MRVEPNSMPRTVFPLLTASWVSFRFMFISQDLKWFLQIYFSGKRQCSFHAISISHITDRGLLFYGSRRRNERRRGLREFGREEGGITFNIAGVSGRFVKLPAAAKRRCWFWGRIFQVRSRQGASARAHNQPPTPQCFS